MHSWPMRANVANRCIGLICRHALRTKAADSLRSLRQSVAEVARSRGLNFLGTPAIPKTVALAQLGPIGII